MEGHLLIQFFFFLKKKKLKNIVDDPLQGSPIWYYHSSKTRIQSLHGRVGLGLALKYGRVGENKKKMLPRSKVNYLG